MRLRPDVWSVGLVMVDDLYVEDEPRTLGLLGGGAAYACVGAVYAGARAGIGTVRSSHTVGLTSRVRDTSSGRADHLRR